MTAHLLLLCHGATASARIAGFPLDDEPLDPAAEAKLRRFRGRMRHSDRQLASPLARAFGTAAALGFDATPEPGLADCNFGRWRGSSLQEAQQREPESVEAWLSDPMKAPHGGESIHDLIVRVRAWLTSQADASGVTLAVTHASVVRAALVAALDAEPRAFWRIDVAPLTTARLSGRAGRWNLVGLGALEAGT